MANTLPKQIIPPDQKLVDENGIITREWWLFFYNLSTGGIVTSQSDDPALTSDTDASASDTDAIADAVGIADLGVSGLSDAEFPPTSAQDVSDALTLAQMAAEADAPVGLIGAQTATWTAPTNKPGLASGGVVVWERRIINGTAYYFPGFA